MKTIKIATDFSDTPLGRVASDGNFNGERFREEFLKPALNSDGQVDVVLDGVEGYGSSFLEEAFGGLVRKGYATAAVLAQRLKIIFTEADLAIYEKLIWQYIKEAKPEK